LLLLRKKIMRQGSLRRYMPHSFRTSLNGLRVPVRRANKCAGRVFLIDVAGPRQIILAEIAAPQGWREKHVERLPAREVPHTRGWEEKK
jgi:hypothetical protein